MVLEGLKVVEFADGFSVPFCGMQFADAGAEVIKVESPEGDRTRGIGPYTNDVSHLFMALNRGKKSVVLDLRTDEGRGAAKALVGSADVVLMHFPPGIAEAYGLDYESLRADNPRLIYASMSDFGTHGPLANRVGSELTAQASSGIWRYLGDMTSREARAGLEEPTRSGSYVSSAWAGSFLFHGALAALLCRAKLGVGQKVESSLTGATIAMQSNTWPVMSNPDKWIGFEILGPMEEPDNGFAAKDGRINGMVRPNRQGSNTEQIEKFYRYLGLDPEDPRLKPQAGVRFARGEAGYELIGSAYQKFTRAELFKMINEEVGTQAAPVHTYSEFLEHPQTQHMNVVVEVEHPKGGTFKTLRAPWVLMDTPVTPAGRPPLLGEHTAEVLATIGLTAAAPTGTRGTAPDLGRPEPFSAKNTGPVGSAYDGRGPLQGVKIVDFSMFQVGPYSGSVLGMLGAHVIKIEAPSGDGILMREPTQNGVPTPYLGFNQGKSQTVCLDLKNPADHEIAVAIIKEADVLIENFRPGVVERLGIGYPAMSKVNPRLVYCSSSGYGQDGPIGFYGCADGFAAAFTGYYSVSGPKGGLGERLRVSTQDATTSLSIVSGALLGLHARAATGKGQWMQTSMLEAISFIQTHRYAEYFSTKTDPARWGSALPNVVPDQAFRTNDNYIAVSATSQEEWRTLCDALDMPSLASDPKFATNDDRVVNRDELVKLLADKFETLPSWWWTLKLHKHGVPCGKYLPLEEVYYNEHARENNFIVDVDLPVAGRLRLAGPPFHFSETPAKIVRPSIGVIPSPTVNPVHGPLDPEQYPNGYPGEHTALLKDRYAKKLSLFAM